jgi:hypothetical protein
MVLQQPIPQAGLECLMLNGADILRVIERDWTFMIDEACVPVKVALQLSDSSSLGMAHKYASFKEIHQDLQYALQAIVNGMAEVLCVCNRI